MANSKIEIINYFDNLINQVDIDIEECLEKYNEEQVIGDLKCYKSYKKKEEYKNLFVMSELSLNKSYEKKHPWQNVEDKIEEMLLKHQTIENPDDLEFNKIYKTVDLWSEETKVVDYLNQVRMRTIEELREAQKEALESYKSKPIDSNFYFQVLYTKTEPEEWIFKLFTFVTDFNMSSVAITLLEELINAREDDFEDLYGQDFDGSDKSLDNKMILIGLFQKFFFENLNSEKFPSPVISVRKRDLLAIKQIYFDYDVCCFNVNNSSSIDLSNLESLNFFRKFEQIEIDGLSSLESLSLRLYSFYSLSLNNLPSLRKLNIYIFYGIEEHSQDLFYNLPSIEYLTLNVSSDVLSYLSYFSLESLVNLKGLSLTGTVNKDFNFDLFENICDHLEKLSINLKNFDNQCLAKLFYGHQFPILKSFSIFMSREITKFEKNLFDRFPMLQSLTINYNIFGRSSYDIDLYAFSNLKQLISLDLSKSYIKSLRNLLFTGLINLKYLNLSRNEIKCIEAKPFSNLINLRLLDLSNNQLCNFDLGILDYTKKIELIDLSENTIENKDEILGRIKGTNIKFVF